MRPIVGRLWLLIALGLSVPLVGERAAGAPLPAPLTTPVTAPAFAYLPLIIQPCEGYTAALHVSAPRATIHVGEVVTLTATLLNQGCVALGQPYYRLTLSPQSALLPPDPAPQEHSFAVAPQSSDAAAFPFTAAATGQTVLTGTVDFEVHFDTGPPLRRRSTSLPLTITVTL